MLEQIIELIRKTSCELPQDIKKALQNAENLENSPCAKTILNTINQNITLARKQNTPICQDTGTLTFYWTLPRGTDTKPLTEICNQAVVIATERGYLRKNTIDTLSGKSIDTNVAPGIPVLHFEQEDVQEITVTLLLKGGGSENMSRQYSLPDSSLAAGRDLNGVRRCILDAVVRIQGLGCAPGILGVCIGADRAEGFAGAKMQLLRKLTDSSPVPELAALEQRLLTEANSLEIGPMGTGGKTTLLGVKICAKTRLPASYFVTIAYMCWACRRQTVTIKTTLLRV